MIGAVEGGGTKFRCALGEAPGQWKAEARFETTSPEQTLKQVAEFFTANPVESLGVGMFGPLDLSRGMTLRTPKRGWDDVPLRQALADALGVPVSVDTDVNAAALAESKLGAGRGLDPVVYITVGTGIGGGAIVHGRPLHGAMHPEMGHLPIPTGPADEWEGHCQLHRRCAEGLASGPAIAARCGAPAETLPLDHEVWDHVAWALAQLIFSIELVLSPEVVVLGGGVMSPSLIAKVRKAHKRARGTYLPKNIRIEAPKLGSDSGLIGAFLLAPR